MGQSKTMNAHKFPFPMLVDLYEIFKWKNMLRKKCRDILYVEIVENVAQWYKKFVKKVRFYYFGV